MNLNSTAYVILGLLSIGDDISGYDMRKAIQGSIGYFWSESYGQLYPALKRLSEAGLIRPSKPDAKSRPNGAATNRRRERQTYRLTDAGRAALRQWLGLPFQNDPPRNEFLLKLFFAREAAPGVAQAHVRDLNDRNRHALELLDRIRASVPKGEQVSPHQPYWLLVLGMGETLTRAALEWGQTALELLEASASPPAANSGAKSAFNSAMTHRNHGLTKPKQKKGKRGPASASHPRSKTRLT